jgi:oligoendopeptidase F
MTTETKYTLGPWSLNDLFTSPDSAEIQETIDTLQGLVNSFEERRPELDGELSTENFMAFVKAIETMTVHTYRLFQFASLRFSEDTQNQQAAAFQSKIHQLYAKLQNQTLFFNLWWKSLDDEQANVFLDDAREFQYYLQEMRNMKPYTLSEAEEKIVNIKNVTGRSAMDRLYNTITSRYTYDIEIDGEMHKELSRDALMQFVTHQDPEVRARTYQLLYAKYGEEASVLGQIYQNIVMDWTNENVDLRSFPTSISPRNLANDVPSEVVDTLLNVAEKNAGLFQRYFKLKASMIGMDKLRRYDLYAPIAKSDRKFGYEDAVKWTLEAFEDFSPELAAMVRKVFDEGHVDSELRPGKRGGAFCSSGIPGVTPWVLLNFAGKIRDISTIAHEMGHAVHAMLASHHSILTTHSSLPLAETASTFCEMLLVDLLLERESDPAVRRDILFRQMDDAYATIIRQSFFALFEKEAHELIRKGASVDEIAEAYMKNLETQFGDSMDIGEEFKWEWVSIPHIYGVPFYVYAYAFGQLLVLALYQQYNVEGESFKPRFLNILAAGGSAAPMDILSQAGIDISTEAFWQGGFDLLEKRLTELEASV